MLKKSIVFQVIFPASIGLKFARLICQEERCRRFTKRKTGTISLLFFSYILISFLYSNENYAQRSSSDNCLKITNDLLDSAVNLWPYHVSTLKQVVL